VNNISLRQKEALELVKQTPVLFPPAKRANLFPTLNEIEKDQLLFRRIVLRSNKLVAASMGYSRSTLKRAYTRYGITMRIPPRTTGEQAQ